jgi:hypothetical protein
LVTAAEVAISAPVVTTHGGIFPTVYSGKRPAVLDDSYVPNLDDDARFIATDIAHSCMPFCMLYVKRCASIFSVVTVDDVDQLAATALQSCFDSLGNVADRHLRYETVVPFYWVEPTGLVVNVPDTPAQKAGYGVISCPGQHGQMPMFENPLVIKDQGHTYAFSYKHRSARTSGWLIHCGYHREDGLACIKPAQYTANRFILNRTDALRLRGARAGFDQYLWTRGQSRIPHPGESIYVNHVNLVCHVLASNFDANTYETRATHAPMASSLKEKVTFICSTLRSIGDGPTNASTRHLNQVRKEGTIILENNRSAWNVGVMANEGTLVFGEYDGPVLASSCDRQHIDIDEQRGQWLPPPSVILETGPPIPPLYNPGPSHFRPPNTGAPTVIVDPPGSRPAGHALTSDPPGLQTAPTDQGKWQFPGKVAGTHGNTTLDSDGNSDATTNRNQAGSSGDTGIQTPPGLPLVPASAEANLVTGTGGSGIPVPPSE